MTEMNWRDLKRELFSSPPRQRSNKTMDRTDIFNAKQEFTDRQTTRITPSNRPSDIFESKQNDITPVKVRYNRTNESQIFSDLKVEQPRGKKTYQNLARDIFNDQSISVIKNRQENPHKIKDHGNEWFYDKTQENPRSLKATPVKQIPTRNMDRTKSARLIKQEELYHSEVAENLNQTSRVLIEINKPEGKSLYQSTTPLQKKIIDNHSDIFNSNTKQLKNSISDNRETNRCIKTNKTSKSTKSEIITQPLKITNKSKISTKK